MQPAVYILASQRNGTLYIGVTSNLVQRIWQHKNDLVAGFTEKYGVHGLVYFELLDDMLSAITREKQLKKWNRAWKLALIEKQNPTWQDLWPTIL
ncbi:GIY-YIG nuclease family protein [Polaromonas hydrogenivorans]|jgi:putative endonuclease|uniref:GIY-YIG nuclease family protein n=1 Tax=Polaromonas hydrogenivorans TaxID=335476 RepID=A0AAU7LVU1_9BURK|nr:GIY-YIG nuclease family protein [Burkholderiales bacterium]